MAACPDTPPEIKVLVEAFLAEVDRRAAAPVA
jgi:hypothetical protein